MFESSKSKSWGLERRFTHLLICSRVIDSEWRLFCNSLGTPFDVSYSLKPNKFSHQVSETNGIEDISMFPNLAYFMRTLLCLPYSITTILKEFSQLSIE